MNEYIPILLTSPLFAQIKKDDLISMLHCLSATCKSYPKDSFILKRNETTHSVGMVISGSAHTIKEDFWGNRTILTKLSKGELFGETFACIGEKNTDIAVVAVKNTSVLYFDMKKILNVCSSACSFHNQLIQNLLSVLAKKNQLLTKKIEHMAKRTTKDKLLSYLSTEALNHNSDSFTIPFNRQQLADYLCVDRSAMSNELSKLREEGILTFHKNQFTLLQKKDYFL